jgi:hypothetical protein
MSKPISIFTAAILLVAGVVGGYGCGSSGHASAWNSRDKAELRNKYNELTNLTPSQRACYAKATEEAVSPSAKEGSELTKELEGAAGKCGIKTTGSQTFCFDATHECEEHNLHIAEEAEKQAQSSLQSTQTTQETPSEPSASAGSSGTAAGGGSGTAQPYGSWTAEETKGIELLLENDTNRACVVRYVEEHESPPGSSSAAEQLAKDAVPTCHNEESQGANGAPEVPTGENSGE